MGPDAEAENAQDRRIIRKHSYLVQFYYRPVSFRPHHYSNHMAAAWL